MNHRALRLTVAFPILLAFSSAAGARTEWKLMFTMGNQFYPAYVVATATKRPAKQDDTFFLGDRNGLWGVSLVNQAAKTRIRLEVRSDQLNATGTFNGLLAEPGKTYEIFPKILYRYDMLLKIQQLIPADVVFKLYLNDKYIGQGAKTLQVHSINDCPRYYTDSHGKGHNISWMHAAYVNEDHPWIDQLLHEALNTKTIGSFSGYQANQAGVLKQVFAIWDVFQRRGFHYSSIAVTPTTGAQVTVRSQTVRFLDQVVKNSQANCVDGAAVFASVLRKINIDPFLVFTPGHCFLGFYLDKEHKQVDYLETTLMGRTDLSNFPEDDAVARSVSSNLGKETKNQASYKAFVKAVQVGADKYRQNKDAVDKKGNKTLQIVDIAEARKLGVLPIAR
jgi:hypothetical protein